MKIMKLNSPEQWRVGGGGHESLSRTNSTQMTTDTRFCAICLQKSVSKSQFLIRYWSHLSNLCASWWEAEMESQQAEGWFLCCVFPSWDATKDRNQLQDWVEPPLNSGPSPDSWWETFLQDQLDIFGKDVDASPPPVCSIGGSCCELVSLAITS